MAAASKPQQLDFLRRVYPAARRVYEKQDGIHPSFVAAQAALETGWQKKPRTNNLFGVTKGSTWDGDVELQPTVEYFNTPDKRFLIKGEEIYSVKETKPDSGVWRYEVARWFRKYPTLEAGLEDHLSVLKNKGYADAWEHRHDPKEFARRISDNVGAKYATAPEYARLVGDVIDTVEARLDELRDLGEDLRRDKEVEKDDPKDNIILGKKWKPLAYPIKG